MTEFEIIMESLDLEGIGEIEITWDFDEDEYKEFLNDGLYHNTYEILIGYIKDYVTFEVETFDNEMFHHVAYESVDYEGLEDAVGETKMAEVVKELLNDGSSRFETLELFNQEEYDVNNPEQLNNIAMKILNHGGYYKDCRGFILTNGVVVYTPMEHNAVSQINGVKNTFDFIRLGNIRVLHQSIDLSKAPTQEQRNVLRQVISSYSDEELYLDIFSEKGGENGCHYVHPDWRYVMGEIDRYFSEGIRPQGNEEYENKKNIGLLISESQYKRLFESIEIGGTPDSMAVYVDDEEVANYKYTDSTAYPFIICNDKLYIGEKSSTHGKLSLEIPGLKRFDEDYGIYGRIWVKAKSNKFNYALVSFWGDNTVKSNCKDKIYELSDKLKVNPNKILIAVNDGWKFSYISLDKWNGIVHPMSEKEEELRNLHMMGSPEKKDNTKSFRNIRGEKIGKKLTNDNGKEMTQAQYHNLIYQESKNIKINGPQYERLFESTEGDNMKIIGTPDYFEIRFPDETVQYNFHDNTAYPFLIFNDKLYIGSGGETHRYLTSKYDMTPMQDYISGRIWINGKSDKFNHPIVSFWGSKNENVKKYISELADKFNINSNDIMVIVGFFNKQPRYISFNEWDGYLKPMSDEEKHARNLHLMNSKDKQQQTKEFRKTRDKKIGERLTNDRGEEMTQAQYHNLIYQESKNIKITQEQYQRLFE